MKKLFFSLALLCLSTVSYAQNTLVGTLTHGEDITMYYGIYALKNAYDAAVDGDVINLSGGDFQAVNITKAITLRGVGIDNVHPTTISNDFDINTASEGDLRFSMEGIKCNNTISVKGVSNPYLIKCCFGNLWISNASQNVMFVNCKITWGLYVIENSSCQLLNSYIANYNVWDDGSKGSTLNCILEVANYYDFTNYVNTQFLNCILYCLRGFEGTAIPSTSIATNCVAIGMPNCFNNSQYNPNCYHASFQEVFKEFTGTYSDTETFELTETAKALFLGTDDTQVGLYGGLMPYSSTPSYPQITKMNVANKTTADGKLSVDIEVSAVQ